MSAEHEGTIAGVSLDDRGAIFRLRSRHATGVELCLFERDETDPAGHRAHPGRPIELDRRGDDLFEVHVPDVGHGQLYGYRVDGPWQPSAGHRFDRRKLLVDPCARALTGRLELSSVAFGLPASESRAPAGPGAYPSSPPGGDTASHVPLSVVIGDVFDWQDVSPPETSLDDGAIYELHVRGMTMQHPKVPAELRGTYLGMAHPAIIEHLQQLGVSAVELMPVAHSESEIHLRRRGLRNYWGYSPLGFCAPDARFATRDDGRQVTELKTLVRELHRAGIAVLVDMVLNHTVEGDSNGPTLSLRGIDNKTYYRHVGDSGRLVDMTGCGNTLDFSEPMVVDLAVQTLRVWAREFRVDGFRFDLAPVLGRGHHGFDPSHPIFERLRSEPTLRGVHWIAEPWDLGPDGYCLGRFPGGFLEWNDRYRQAMRQLWCGDGISPTELGARLAGSADLFEHSSSIDYVTSHDGFTLEDLTSYEHKHNLANGEENRDGSDHNQSRNWGVEGPSDDAEVRRRRRGVKRSLLVMLAVSRATPMILHGDELGRSQSGNNNAYCQDNPISWINWSLDPEKSWHLEFTRRAMALRRRLRRWVGPDPIVELLPRAALSSEAGSENSHPADRDLLQQAVVRYRSRSRAECEALLLINAEDRAVTVEIPDPPIGARWQMALATGEGETLTTFEQTATFGLSPEGLLELRPLSSMVLVSV